MTPRPPFLSSLLVRLFFRGAHREVVLGDLDEGFADVAARVGRSAANRWYRWHALASLGALTKDRAAMLIACLIRMASSAAAKVRRRQKGDSLVSFLWYEARLAARSLMRRPGFSMVAALTLALGIGANAAIFSVLNGVVLKPLPYHEPQNLVTVVTVPETRPDDPGDFMSHWDIADLLDQSPALETLVGYDTVTLTLTGTGEPLLVRAARLTDGLLETFRLAPEMGRDVRDEECGPEAPRIAVISYGLWRDRYGMATDVLGRTIQVNGRDYEVIGVAPEGFQFPARTQMWIPHRLRPEQCGRSCHNFFSVGRLAPGATVTSSRAEAETIARSLAKAYPESNTDKGFRVDSLQDRLVGGVRAPLWILLAAVAAVLLIACANVANLLLVRASARTGEFAVRAALGAGRRRLAVQVIMESALLALAGGAAGLLLAWGAVGWLSMTTAGMLPRAGEITVDTTVVGFTLVLVIGVTLIFGASPAAYLSRVPLSDNLNHAGRGSDRGRLGRRWRSLLVGLEVALSVVLLIGAGLLLRSFERLYAVDLGFETRGVVRFTLSLPSLWYDSLEDVRMFCRTLESRIATLPGVESVGSIYGAPLGEAHTISVVLVEGRQEPQPGRETYAAVRAVSPDYLETMRIPLIRGRGLERADDTSDVPVGVVNQAFVRENFPTEDPLGKKVRIKTNMGYGSPYWMIVGIVGDIRSRGLKQEPVPEIYVPHGQFGPGYLTITARSGVDAETLLPAIRSQVWSLDPNLPLQNIETVADAVRREVAPTRFLVLMLGSFAFLALTLAAVGLYGVLGYLVSQRTREIGIRVAVGAGKAEIVRMVLSDGIWPVVAGTAAGLAIAFSTGRILEAVLYDVTVHDPWILALVPTLVLVTALLSMLTPARRAGRVDPVRALRME